MARGIIARKLGMTQVFDEAGKSVPVTVLRAGPCRVLQVKTLEKDSYNAVQLGFEQVRPVLLSKAQKGHQAKTESTFKILREFRDAGDFEVGQEITADIFEAGQSIKVTGTSKGKGFAGVMKRYGFGGGRATHGSGFHRAPGSLNATTTPGRVFKGKELPGHMGVDKVTVRKVKIVQVDPQENLILVKGAVPGPVSSIIRIEAMS